MRGFDASLGLLSAGSLYGAVVSWVGDVPAVAATFLGISLVALIAMVARARSATRVLVVGDSPQHRRYRLHDALDDAGYATRSCPGPEGRPCPVLAGDPCPIRRPVEAAVIVRGAAESGPTPPCGRALGIPAVVFLEEPEGNEERVRRWADLIAAGVGGMRLQKQV